MRKWEKHKPPKIVKTSGRIRFRRVLSEIRGAHHLTENFRNSGWKVNGKVTLFSEIPTENWEVHYTFCGSLLITVGLNQRNVAYRVMGSCAYHLPISRFLLGSRLTLHIFASFLDSNRNGCGNSAVNWQGRIQGEGAGGAHPPPPPLRWPTVF